MTAEQLYLDLLKRCLTRSGFVEWREVTPTSTKARTAVALLERVLAPRGVHLMRAHDPSGARRQGRDWPAEAETMIGLERLNNIQFCVTDVLRRTVPGDLIETGVWRGGATIFMRGILRAYRDTTRAVWVADSFQGLPKPSGRYEADLGDDHWTRGELAVTVDQVRANFARYGLLDERVRFLEGFFADTLPTAPIERLAVVRLDGDMYESTIDAMNALYPKLSVGGYLIVDDYKSHPACRRAIDEYRAAHGIEDELVDVDWAAIYWRRTRL